MEKEFVRRIVVMAALGLGVFASGAAAQIELNTDPCPFIFLRSPGDTKASVTQQGCGGGLTLGGGGNGGAADSGHLTLTDTDGSTTAIELDGEFGSIVLGSNNEDGDLLIKDENGADSFHVDGASGDTTQQSSGNGLVKAWARVSATGVLVGGSTGNFNCTSASLFSTGTGIYTVTCPFAPNIQSRPRMAIVDNHGGQGGQDARTIQLTNASDSQTVAVRITGSDGSAKDGSFTLVIY